MKRPLAPLVALILALSGCKGSGGSSTALDPFLGRSRIEPPRTGTISPQPPGNSYYSGSAQPGLAQPFTTPAAIPGPNPNSSPTWTAPQSRPAPAPGPASPYGGSPYPPLSGGSSSTLPPSSPSVPSAASGEGDRITIPFAARVISDPPRQLAASGRPINPLRSDAAPTNRPAGGTPAIASGPGVSSPNWRSPGQPGPASNATGTDRLAGRDRVIQVIEPGPRDYANPLRNAPRPVDPSPRPDAQPPRSEPGRPVNISDLPEPK